MFIDVPGPPQPPRRDRAGDILEGKVTLKRLMGLRFITRQRKCGNEKYMGSCIVRTDCDRSACPFYRLIVLLQRRMSARFVRVPCRQRWFAWT